MNAFDWMLLLQISQLEGVYAVQEPHFWTLCSDVYVGCIKVEVAPNADSKYITSQTHNILTQVCYFSYFVLVKRTQLLTSIKGWLTLNFH